MELITCVSSFLCASTPSTPNISPAGVHMGGEEAVNLMVGSVVGDVQHQEPHLSLACVDSPQTTHPVRAIIHGK